MSDDEASKRQAANRREFLTGKPIRDAALDKGLLPADATIDDNASRRDSLSGASLRLATTAMATEFALLLNPGLRDEIELVYDALDIVHELEQQLTVYRDDSEMSFLNRQAGDGPTSVSENLFELLQQAVEISQATGGAFDPTSGPLIALWRRCRQEQRIPDDNEIAAALDTTGVDKVKFAAETLAIEYTHAGVELNLGGIGKGYALDEVGRFLHKQGVADWLVHGGNSSMLAAGNHISGAGWPVGVRNPLFPAERLATIRLQDRALGSSGSGVQYFRHDGKRYGHILDPRDGHPVDHLLSVTVLGPTAAEADALGTAFFVLGLENALAYCDNHREISALLIPQPRQGRKLQPVVRGLSPEDIVFPADVQADFR